MVVALGQAAAASGLLLLREDRIWVAFVFQGLVAALAAFVKPAIDAAIPNLVDDDRQLRTANAMFASTWGVMLAAAAAGTVYLLLTENLRSTGTVAAIRRSA